MSGRYRRLAIRYERRVDIYQPFLYLTCPLSCLNFLHRHDQFRESL